LFIALVPLLFLALVLLGLIFVLWMKARLLQKRIDALTDDVRTLAGRLQARETDRGQ
jgi:Tfp pilus assembly protein PilX